MGGGVGACKTGQCRTWRGSVEGCGQHLTIPAEEEVRRDPGALVWVGGGAVNATAQGRRSVDDKCGCQW